MADKDIIKFTNQSPTGFTVTIDRSTVTFPADFQEDKVYYFGAFNFTEVQGTFIGSITNQNTTNAFNITGLQEATLYVVRVFRYLTNGTSSLLAEWRTETKLGNIYPLVGTNRITENFQYNDLRNWTLHANLAPSTIPFRGSFGQDATMGKYFSFTSPDAWALLSKQHFDEKKSITLEFPIRMRVNSITGYAFAGICLYQGEDWYDELMIKYETNTGWKFGRLTESDTAQTRYFNKVFNANQKYIITIEYTPTLDSNRVIIDTKLVYKIDGVIIDTVIGGSGHNIDRKFPSEGLNVFAMLTYQPSDSMAFDMGEGSYWEGDTLLYSATTGAESDFRYWEHHLTYFSTSKDAGAGLSEGGLTLNTKALNPIRYWSPAYAFSPIIHSPKGYKPNEIIWERTLPSNTTANMSIVNADTNEVIVSNLNYPIHDLSDITLPINIKLKADLTTSTDELSAPTISYARVNYGANVTPPIITPIGYIRIDTPNGIEEIPIFEEIAPIKIYFNSNINYIELVDNADSGASSVKIYLDGNIQALSK